MVTSTFHTHCCICLIYEFNLKQLVTQVPCHCPLFALSGNSFPVIIFTLTCAPPFPSYRCGKSVLKLRSIK